MPSTPLSLSYSRTAPEPPTLRALAIAHFAVAGISLLFYGIHGAVESTQADHQFEKALRVVDNEPTQAMRQALRRSIDIKDGLRDYLIRKLPLSPWHGQANQVVDFLTSLVLIAAGAALYKRQPIGRALSLGYAGISLLQKLFNFIYLSFYEAPIAKTYLESLQRLYPEDAGLIQCVLDPISTGPLYQVLFAAYPVLVAVVMLQPQIVERLQGPANAAALPSAPPAQIVIPSAAFPDDLPSDFSQSPLFAGERAPQ